MSQYDNATIWLIFLQRKAKWFEYVCYEILLVEITT